MALCTVCGQVHVKYKCPQCKEPSCSLPCFQIHKEKCAAASEYPTDASAIKDHARTLNTSKKAQSKTEGSNLHVADFESLFQQYPQLKTKLRSIYLATLDPNAQPVMEQENQRWANVRDSESAGRSWTPQKGCDKGLRLLGEALDDADPSLGGLQPFMELVAREGSQR